MLVTIVGFILCGSIIFYAGKKLSHYGDTLAELTGMGKAWVGLILMASVTSLPELFVGISAASFVGSADLAVGDVLGSCVFNLAILSLLDVFTKKTTVFSYASQSHILTAGLGIILLSFVGLDLILPFHFYINSWIAISSVVFIILYLLSVKIIYQYDKKLSASQQDINDALHDHDKISLKKVIFYYVLNALLVIVAALLLPRFVDEIANYTGIQKSFAGTLLLAISTSLPEISVSFSSFHRDSVDMAIGNLFGSNLFNIFILALDDLFYTKGFILGDASHNNIITVFFVIIMTAVAIIALIYRTERKNFLMAWDTLLILMLYIVNMIILYKL